MIDPMLFLFEQGSESSNLLKLPDTGYTWFIALLIGLLPTGLSLGVQQFINDDRNHHTTKLINEILGKLQFPFAFFFFSLVAVEEVYRRQIPREFLVLTVLFGIFALIAVTQIKKQDEKIMRGGHICAGDRDEAVTNLLVDLANDLQSERQTNIRNKESVRRKYKEKVDRIRATAKCSEKLTFGPFIRVCWVNASLFVLSCLISYFYIISKLV